MASSTVQMNIRVKPALHAKAKRRAKEDRTTLQAVVEAALAAYVKGEQGK